MAVTMDCTASCMLCFICYYLLLICTVSAGNKVGQIDREDIYVDRRKRSVDWNKCNVPEDIGTVVHYGRFDYPRDCEEVFHNCENLTSGVYLIQPDGSYDPFQVFCNNTIDGGSWTVFQRRIDGSLDFYRNWNEYKNGFGFLNREFWLGNDKLALLTNQKDYSLRIDVVDLHGNAYFAKYETFRISDEYSKFKLVNIDGYDSSSSTGEDKLSWHKNKLFSTYDRDNDDWTDYNCAEKHMGAWWFGELDNDISSNCNTDNGFCERFPNSDGDGCAECGHLNLNGVYGTTEVGTNIFIDVLSGNDNDCGLQYTGMKIRPRN